MSVNQGFLGLIMETAKNFGRDAEAMEAMLTATASVRTEMFSGRDLIVYEGVVESLNRSQPPSPHTVSLTANLPVEQVGEYLMVGRQFATLREGSDRVRHTWEQARLSEGLARAMAATKEGRLDDARTLSRQASELGGLRALQSQTGFDGFAFNPDLDPRIPLCFGRLNPLIGGGLGYGGKNAMSLLVAASNTGKSSFAQILSLGLLHGGHHVHYVSGEATKDEILTEMARLHAGISFESMQAMSRGKGLPVDLRKLARAIEELAALPGRLWVEEDLEVADVRELSRGYARLADELRGDGPVRSGRLVTMVDNIDHVIHHDPRSGLREDQTYEREAWQCLEAAKRDGYHLMWLSQTNAEGEKRSGPPHKEDIAHARAMIRHVGTSITLHRPTTEADHAQLERDENGDMAPGRRARTWVACRKTRGGRLGALEFASDPRNGRWYDPQEPATLEALL